MQLIVRRTLSSDSRWSRWLILALVIGILNLILYFRGIPYLPPSPGFQVAATARAIARQGTIQRFQEDYRQVVRMSQENPGKTVWQDMFSLGDQGEVYPKHAILLSWIAAPFYIVFGEAGFWILNQLLIVGVCASVSGLLARYCNPTYITIYLTGVLGLTQLLYFSYDFSYDLFATFLVLGGIALSYKYPFSGSALIGLVGFIRIIDLVYIPFLFLALCWSTQDKAKIVRSFAGFGFSLGALALNNLYLWGSPLTTAYQRIPDFENGIAVIHPQSHVLALSYLFERWPEKLFGSSNGLLMYNPILCLFPLGVWKALRSKKLLLLAVMTAAVLHITLIFSYSMWFITEGGNRFLLTPVLLLTVCILSSAKQKDWRPRDEKSM